MSQHNDVPVGIYKHYKGNYYNVFGTGIHTETNEKLVFYSDTDGNFFCRPLSMWFELVNGNPRFVRVIKK